MKSALLQSLVFHCSGPFQTKEFALPLLFAFHYHDTVRGGVVVQQGWKQGLAFWSRHGSSKSLILEQLWSSKNPILEQVWSSLGAISEHFWSTLTALNNAAERTFKSN